MPDAGGSPCPDGPGARGHPHRVRRAVPRPREKEDNQVHRKAKLSPFKGSFLIDDVTVSGGIVY